MKKSKKTKNTDKTFETRRAAFRAAKRDHGVPVTKHPDDVIRPRTPDGIMHELDTRNRRLYIFRFLLNLFGVGSKEKKVFIREDKEVFYSKTRKQMDQFNARLEENFHLRRRQPWMDVNN